MKYKKTLNVGEYVDVEYYQFNQSRGFTFIWNVCMGICFVVLLPLIAASRLSNPIFKSCSELLSLIPSLFGFIVRYTFYKFTLLSCGKNVIIDFGTVFYYRQISIGNNVTFGMNNIVQHCDFGDNVLVADSCRFTGGTQKHHFQRTDIPINRQGGKIKKIKVDSDTWIDLNSIVMESIGQGSIVKPGSVVIEEIEPYSICSGNPATIIDKRI